MSSVTKSERLDKHEDNMLTLDECKKHLAKLNLPDQEMEKIRDLLYAFVERTLDYVIENGMFVDEEDLCKEKKTKPTISKK